MAARDGIIMGTGPRIRGEDLDLGEINIYDILPTILYIMGLPIPNRLDGRVIRDVIEPGSPEAEDQIEYKTYHVEPSLERGEFGQGEGVRQSLRDLGYIS
jgi:arylsulfatase A-like enzyme